MFVLSIRVFFLLNNHYIIIDRNIGDGSVRDRVFFPFRFDYSRHKAFFTALPSQRKRIIYSWKSILESSMRTWLITEPVRERVELFRRKRIPSAKLRIERLSNIPGVELNFEAHLRISVCSLAKCRTKWRSSLEHNTPITGLPIMHFALLSRKWGAAAA